MIINESIIILFAIIGAVWFMWVPLRYMYRNVINCDFDFYRDLEFYYCFIKLRYKSKFGKITLVYLVIFISYMIIKHIMNL